MIKKTYSEKLQDPRWQKKRLEILERDKWTCTTCGGTEETLHVHHKSYGPNPWDVENDQLVTLCKSCQEIEENYIKDFKEKSLSWVLKSEFSVEDITYFLQDLEKANIYHPKWKLLSAIMYMLNNEDAQNILISLYEIRSSSRKEGRMQCMKENNIVEPEFPF